MLQDVGAGIGIHVQIGIHIEANKFEKSTLPHHRCLHGDRDYVEIADDIFMNDKEPLREGTLIYEARRLHHVIHAKNSMKAPQEGKRIYKGYRQHASPWTCGISQAKRQNEEIPREKSDVDDGYIQISDDNFMYNEKPLRKGTYIYKGYQQHVFGKHPLAIEKIVSCEDSHITEGQHLLKLSLNPNFVQIIHSKERHGDARILYIVKELWPQNLQGYIDDFRQKNAPLDNGQVRSIMLDISRGLQYIHGHEIIHRVVKPEKVLFSHDEKQFTLSDFGISKQLKDGDLVTKQTSLGQGSVGCMAREAENSDSIPQSADIFHSDVTMFGLWSNGKHPFGDKLSSRNHNIAENEGRDLSGLLISGIKKKQHDPRKIPSIEEIAQHPFFTDKGTSRQVPSKVRGLKVTEHAADCAKITWDPAEGATSYEVYLDRGNKELDILPTGETTIELERLCSDRIHVVHVAGMNEAGSGPPSEQLKIIAVPAKVRGLKITKHTVDNWNLSWDAAGGAKSYEGHLYKLGEESETLLTEETTIKLTSPCPDRIHSVRIAGINEAGQGPLSEQIEIPTDVTTTEPARPIVSWITLEQPASRYIVKWTRATTTQQLETFTEPLVYLSSFTGREYCGRVVSRHRGHEGGNNAAVQSCATLKSAPSHVRGLKITEHTADVVKLALDASAGAKVYEVHLDHPGEKAKILLTGETTIKLESLSNHGPFPLSGRLKFHTAPSKVRGLKIIERTADTVKLAWKAGDGAESYEVHLDHPEEKSKVLLTEETTIKLEGLSNGGFFFVRIAGINEAGRGPLSKRLRIAAVPSAPTDIQSKHLRASPHSSIVVTFEDKNQGSKKYIVHALSLGVNKLSKHVKTRSQSAILGGLLPGESYEISVATQQGSLTSERTVNKSPIQMYPCKPMGLTAIVQDKALRIQWNHLAIPPQSYMVEIRVKDRVMKEYTENNFLTKHELLPGSVYEVSVAAVNKAGIGLMSDAVKVTTVPAPPECPMVFRNPRAPTTSLIVSFEDQDTVGKCYKIKVDPTNGDDTIERETTQKYVTINGLKPGQRYIVNVVSIVDGKTSEPVCCEPKAWATQSPVDESSSDEDESGRENNISYPISGGEFQGANFGPQMNKKVYKAPDYTNAVIYVHHHYYGGTTGEIKAMDETPNPASCHAFSRVRRNVLIEDCPMDIYPWSKPKEKTVDSYPRKFISYLSRVLNTLPFEKIKNLAKELQETFEIYSPDDLSLVEMEELNGLETLKSTQKRKFLSHVQQLQNEIQN